MYTRYLIILVQVFRGFPRLIFIRGFKPENVPVILMFYVKWTFFTSTLIILKNITLFF